MLNECINDPKELKKDGIAVVTSNKIKPFLTDKKFLVHNGFKVVDEAYPYFELLTLSFDSTKESPRFTENAKEGIVLNKNKFSFIYSNQCPFMEEYVELLSNILKNKNISFEVIKLTTCKEAQELGSPFGTLGIYYNGKFVTHELMTENKFEKFIEEVMK